MRNYISKFNVDRGMETWPEDIVVYKRVLLRRDGELTNAAVDSERKYKYVVGEVMTAVNNEGKEEVKFSKPVVSGLCLLKGGGLFSCFKEKESVEKLCSLINSDEFYNRETKKNNKGEEVENKDYGRAVIAKCIIPAFSKYWKFENGELGAQKLKILKVL